MLTSIREGGTVPGEWEAYAQVSDLDPKNTLFPVLRKHQVFSDYDYISEQEIDASEFYQRLLFPSGLRYMVGAKLESEAGEFSLLGSLRSADRGHVKPRETVLTGEIARHLSQACEFARRIDSVANISADLRVAINYLPDAIFVLNADASVVDLNRNAEALLRSESGLRVWRRYLMTENAESTRILHDTVASAARRAPGPDAGQAIALPQKHGLRPLQMLGLPLSKEQRDFPYKKEELPLVLLIVANEEDRPQTQDGRLRQLFGFTPAEARMASAFLAGESVNSYAEKSGIAVSTARSTMKQLLAKTDCRRQSELMRLLTRLTTTAAVE